MYVTRSKVPTLQSQSKVPKPLSKFTYRREKLLTKSLQLTRVFSRCKSRVFGTGTPRPTAIAYQNHISTEIRVNFVWHSTIL